MSDEQAIVSNNFMKTLHRLYELEAIRTALYGVDATGQLIPISTEKNWRFNVDK